MLSPHLVDWSCLLSFNWFHCRRWHRCDRRRCLWIRVWDSVKNLLLVQSGDSVLVRLGGFEKMILPCTASTSYGNCSGLVLHRGILEQFRGDVSLRRSRGRVGRIQSLILEPSPNDNAGESTADFIKRTERAWMISKVRSFDFSTSVWYLLDLVDC